MSIAAGTGADVMAGGSGAAGPAPDVRHQPPGNLAYPQKNSNILGYPEISWDITELGGISQDNPTWWISWDILGYLEISWDITELGGISQDNPTWWISWDNT